MVKNSLLGLSLVFLVSCTQVNSSGEKTVTKDGDTVADVDISLSKMDMVEELSKIDEPEADKIVFRASGTEPGWFAEISKQKIRIVLDYGKDSLITEYSGPALTEGAGFEFKGKDYTINVTPDACIDAASGDKKDSKVTITHNGKKYTGCGSSVK